MRHAFQRIADGIAERLVHVGDQSLDTLVLTAADADHQLRQAAGVHLFLHESAVANLDVQNQRVEADGDFLGHDRAGNKWDALDGTRDVAKRVELAVGRGDLVGLADKGELVLGQLSFELLDAQIYIEARDRFQLVDGSAGMSQTATADHGNRDASGGGQRGRNQAGLVAHATGGMLVDLQAGQGREIEAFAALDHDLG